MNLLLTTDDLRHMEARNRFYPRMKPHFNLFGHDTQIPMTRSTMISSNGSRLTNPDPSGESSILRAILSRAGRLSSNGPGERNHAACWTMLRKENTQGSGQINGKRFLEDYLVSVSII